MTAPNTPILKIIINISDYYTSCASQIAAQKPQGACCLAKDHKFKCGVSLQFCLIRAKKQAGICIVMTGEKTLKVDQKAHKNPGVTLSNPQLNQDRKQENSNN